jgi:hypothetical protein
LRLLLRQAVLFKMPASSHGTGVLASCPGYLPLAYQESRDPTQ